VNRSVDEKKSEVSKDEKIEFVVGSFVDADRSISVGLYRARRLLP